MTLDLNTITTDWPYPTEGVCARVVTAEDGRSFLQMRIELGVLQMFPDGRPDGDRYRTSECALHFVQKAMNRGRTLDEQDWSELKRELQQFNYRRVAFTSLAEEALEKADTVDAQAHLLRCVRDIDHCIQVIKAMEEGRSDGAGPQALLIPTLIFNRSKQLAQLRMIEGRQEEAIEEAEAGAKALERFFSEQSDDGGDEEVNPGVQQLRALADQLRKAPDPESELRGQLEQAVEREDFEAAARLRDQLRGIEKPEDGTK